MNMRRILSGSIAVTGLFLSAASFAQASDFDPKCHYSYDAKPEWSDVTRASKPIAVGVTMTPNGGLVRLVPGKGLAKKLRSTTSQDEWIAVFASASETDFIRHARKQDATTPYDLTFNGPSIAVFRLFKTDWNFAPNPFTVGHNIPVLANGFTSHKTPHYVLDSPQADKIAIMGFYQAPSQFNPRHCVYKYDINLDVMNDGFVTRVIIDPEVDVDGVLP